jgi:hypothetical protein
MPEISQIFERVFDRSPNRNRTPRLGREQELMREESALKKKVPQQPLADKHLFI